LLLSLIKFLLTDVVVLAFSCAGVLKAVAMSPRELFAPFSKLAALPKVLEQVDLLVVKMTEVFRFKPY